MATEHMSGRKGLLPTSGAVFVVVIGILAMIMSYIVFYMMTGTKTQVFLDSSRMYQLGIVSSEIKSFLETASGYAFDQSVYETLSDGMLTADSQQSISGVRVWKSTDADASPTFAETKSELEGRYRTVMAQYLSGLKSKQIFMMEKPSESDVGVAMTLRVAAVSEAPSEVDTTISPIKIGTSQNSYALVDADTHQFFAHAVAAVFNKGKELLSSSDAMKASVQGVNYCMKDDEIKDSLCGAIEAQAGHVPELDWSMSCEADRMEITRGQDAGRYALDVTMYPLVTVEENGHDMLVFNGSRNVWSRTTLNYYMVVEGASYVDCCPGDTKACTADNGCASTSTCGDDYEWGACESPCTPGDSYGECTKPDGTAGTLTCVNSNGECSKKCDGEDTTPENPPASCACTPWVDAGCGGGNCGEHQMYQKRTCVPFGCGSQGQCVGACQTSE